MQDGSKTGLLKQSKTIISKSLSLSVTDRNSTLLSVWRRSVCKLQLCMCVNYSTGQKPPNGIYAKYTADSVYVCKEHVYSDYW